MDISIVIPIKDETDKHLPECLENLKTQEYSGDFEILVLKGGNRAQARNFGINLAKGDIVAFIDSDCLAPYNWLSSISVALKNLNGFGGVGGVNISPMNSSLNSRVINYIFSTYLGSLGSASLHQPSSPKFVSALACINSAFWRRTLIESGGFDEEYVLCEDTNLSYNVRKKGAKLFLDPKIVVKHYRRDQLSAFSKQFFSYGEGRMRSILTNVAYASFGLLLPFVGVFITMLLLLVMPSLAAIIFITYLGVLVFYGVKGAIKFKQIAFLPLVPGFFIIEHFSFFCGMLRGLFRGKWKKETNNSELFLHITSDDIANNNTG